MSDVVDFNSKRAEKEKADKEPTEELVLYLKDGTGLQFTNPEYGVSQDMPNFLVVRPKDEKEGEQKVLMYNTDDIKAIYSTLS
jgi:hypothetical protein